MKRELILWWVAILGVVVMGAILGVAYAYQEHTRDKVEIQQLKAQNEYVFFGRCVGAIDKKSKLPAGMARDICGSVLKYAMQYNEDPFKVLAVMGVESGYKPVALSSAGAVGLMQVIPTYWAKACALEHHGFWNTRDNIRCGVHVLAEYRQYGKHQLLAYNAGPGNIALGENGYTDRVHREYAALWAPA